MVVDVVEEVDSVAEEVDVEDLVVVVDVVDLVLVEDVEDLVAVVGEVVEGEVDLVVHQMAGKYYIMFSLNIIIIYYYFSSGFGGGRGRGGGFKSPGGGRGRGGGGRGGGGRGGPGGMKGGKKVLIEPHQRLEGIFIARGKEDALVTLNLVPGDSVYGEKRISVDAENGSKTEYRIWNPFRSKLGAAILGGVEDIHIKPGSRVLYLGAASGTTVSHVSDIVGQEGRVYAVEFSHRSGRDLLGVAQKRSNIVPIIEDARHPHKYRMLVSMVDTIFADVAQPDQARIVLLNAQYFLKIGGHVVISIKVSVLFD